MPLRQQVVEEGREFKAGRAEIGQQLAECVLDAQAQNRPGWITDISLIESEHGALAAHHSEGADGLDVETDEKGGYICPSRSSSSTRDPAGLAVLADSWLTEEDRVGEGRVSTR